MGKKCKSSSTTAERVAAVRDVLVNHPTKVVWNQQQLASYLARQFEGTDDPPFLGHYRYWVHTTCRLHLAGFLLFDPISGWCAGYCDMPRLMKSLPSVWKAKAVVDHRGIKVPPKEATRNGYSGDWQADRRKLVPFLKNKKSDPEQIQSQDSKANGQDHR